MTTTMALPVEQHNVEIQRNREAWSRKPALREVYYGFYRLIASRIDPKRPGLVVELGSGMGRIKEIIPTCVTTDLFPNPWLDRQENAYRLSFADDSVSHLILFDVWHHLRYPGTALREFRRVLVPGGCFRVVLPDAELVMKRYFEAPNALVAWRGHGGTAMEAVNSCFRQRYEHQFLYDWPTLEQMLRRAGFDEVVRVAFGRTRRPELALDDPKYEWESLYVEAIKP